MQPYVSQFTTHTFLSDPLARNWVRLDQVVEYFRQSATEFFLMNLPLRIPDTEPVTTVEMSVDGGSSFVVRDMFWIVEHISEYKLENVYIDADWSRKAISAAFHHAFAHSKTIIEKVMRFGYFAIGSTKRDLDDPYHTFLVEVVKATIAVDAALLMPQLSDGKTIENMWIFWNTAYYKDPEAVVTQKVEANCVTVTKSAGIVYCLHKR